MCQGVGVVFSWEGQYPEERYGRGFFSASTLRRARCMIPRLVSLFPRPLSPRMISTFEDVLMGKT